MRATLEKRTVLEEIADNVCAAFDSIKGREKTLPWTAEERESLEKDLLEKEKRLKRLSKKQLKALEKEEQGQNAAEKKSVREASRTFSREFARLKPETLPKVPDVAERLIRMFGRISYAYTRDGASDALALLEYVRTTSFPRAWWLWQTFIAASIATEDYPTAEYLLQVECEHHDFAVNAKKFHPNVSCAKAVIALKRDGDLDKALEYAGRAKGAYGDEVSTKLFSTLKTMKEKSLSSDQMRPIGLLTGEWSQKNGKTKGEKK